MTWSWDDFSETEFYVRNVVNDLTECEQRAAECGCDQCKDREQEAFGQLRWILDNLKEEIKKELGK